MNTIQEVTNGDLNGNTTSKSAPNVNVRNNISNTSSNSSSTSTSTSATTSTSTGKSPNRPASQTSFNGSSNSSADKEKSDELKIIGHIKNIEKIAEKRRVFLNNTISEYSVDEKLETETKIVNGDVINSSRTHTREEGAQHIDTVKEATINVTPVPTQTEPKFSTFPKQPKSPPPKPPMLNRTRSLGMGDNRNAPPTPITPTNTPILTTAAPIAQAELSATPMASPSNATHSAVSAEPVDMTDVQLRDNEMQTTRRYERVERPMSLSPASPKQISVNHYERIIEELKCPGCAYPMKAPILLCKTGHSICQQCTRVLLMCPLCKEPFTNMRSLTVEALCSKAHFRCANSAGGCTVRLQIDLLSWHEKQCIYKPMKCFMGRVWGDCDWSGREAYWKDHLEKEHTNKVFHTESIDLIWNMGVKQKSLTGYYVFIVFDEMFNFYEVYDKDRVLFTMACTSTVREKKHSYAYEVTLIHHDNEALAITHKYPVHSEYDNDILAEGSCVSIAYNDLAKFIDEERLLHYRVRVLEIKTPRRQKTSQRSTPSSGVHPIDFQQTQIEGVNLKSVPADVIVTRKADEIPYADSATATPTSVAVSDAEGEQMKVKSLYSGKFSSNDSGSESDAELDAFIAKKWGTPQMHFNRKFLNSNSNDSASSTGVNSSTLCRDDRKLMLEDKLSVCSTSTTYKQRVANSLRKSFRGFKTSQLFNRKPSERSINHS